MRGQEDLVVPGILVVVFHRDKWLGVISVPARSGALKASRRIEDGGRHTPSFLLFHLFYGDGRLPRNCKIRVVTHEGKGIDGLYIERSNRVI